jgi:hypothetical protein
VLPNLQPETSLQDALGGIDPGRVDGESVGAEAASVGGDAASMGADAVSLG